MVLPLPFDLVSGGVGAYAGYVLSINQCLKLMSHCESPTAIHFGLTAC
jgi:hypothetical protein